ncbi:MAG: hypothetical protein LW878_12315 [Proteobacteria bacterium]|nr:hypothetical protein [Pseudomonadota bacterium]
MPEAQALIKQLSSSTSACAYQAPAFLQHLGALFGAQRVPAQALAQALIVLPWCTGGASTSTSTHGASKVLVRKIAQKFKPTRHWRMAPGKALGA